MATDVQSMPLAQLRQWAEKAQNSMSRLREESREQNGLLARSEDVVKAMARKVPKVATPVVQTTAIIGGAYGGAYAQEYLDEKNAGKIGPAPAIPLLGLLTALGGAFLIEDPDIQLGVVSLGAGVAAGGAARAGREMRQKHKTALEQMAQTQTTTQQPPAAKK